MSIDDLKQVLIPPIQPTEPGTENDWNNIQNRLGITLPDDYKVYINLFGSGLIADFIWIYNPFSSDPDLNLIQQIPKELEFLLEHRKDYGGNVPYPLYPEKNGILPWGNTTNGDVLYWISVGQANDWPVAVCESRVAFWEYYNCSMSIFLTKLFRQEISSNIFPKFGYLPIQYTPQQI